MALTCKHGGDPNRCPSHPEWSQPAGGMEQRTREFLRGIEYPDACDIAAFATSEVRRALEEACKAICARCKVEMEQHENCRAEPIRKLMEAEHE